jgi:SH3-like domain-containing protein
MRKILLAFSVVCMLAAGDGRAAEPAKPATPTVAKTSVPAKAVEPTAAADNVNAGPQLPVPRFVTLSVDEVNVRTGPALKYPIKFIIRKDGLPVEIVREFDVWRQIRDVDGDGGWVHKSMLSGKRAVIIRGKTEQRLLKKPDENARPVVKLEPGVIASLGKNMCKGAWCDVKVQGYNGWIKRDDVWGVYPDEKFQE